MLVVFEGIDGGGKTTLSNGVARELRRRGLEVAHVREGGRFASRVAQRVRDFARDARNLDLCPRAELLLYLAREAQVAEETLVPALERADVVIADRFIHTAEVLATWGRGLQAAEVSETVRAAGGRVEPDLVFLVDVDPHLARARRRVSRILELEARFSSRKGLAGSGLQHRLREGYRCLAVRRPDQWVVIDNDEPDPDELVAAVANVVERARSWGPKAAAAHAREHIPAAAANPPPIACAADALQALLAWVDRRSRREPAVAAYFLSGLHGPSIDERLAVLAEDAPEIVAYGLTGSWDAASVRLRRKLSSRAPRHVARSLWMTGPLSHASADEVWRLRAEHAVSAPAEVARSLEGLDDDQAWTLRGELYAREPAAVVDGLAGLGNARAWAWRERWLKTMGGDPALEVPEVARIACRSISGLSGARAWSIREAARSADPVGALASVVGLDEPESWRWRRDFLERAPRSVMGTIRGMDSPAAWVMRGRVAQRSKEALDSMIGIAGSDAWILRDALRDVWPSTVVKSLGALAEDPRGRSLVERQLRLWPANLSLLKHAGAIALGLHKPSAGMAA